MPESVADVIKGSLEIINLKIRIFFHFRQVGICAHLGHKRTNGYIFGHLYPSGTHAQLQVVMLEFNAADPNADAVSIARSSYLDVGKSEDTEAEVLTVDLQPQPESAVLIMMGIAYFQFVNGGYYPLANGQYNALTIVDVDIP